MATVEIGNRAARLAQERNKPRIGPWVHRTARVHVRLNDDDVDVEVEDDGEDSLLVLLLLLVLLWFLDLEEGGRGEVGTSWSSNCCCRRCCGRRAEDDDETEEEDEILIASEQSAAVRGVDWVLGGGGYGARIEGAIMINRWGRT
jgi:hypothetical protein